MQVLRAERGQTAKSRRPEAASLVSFGVSRIQSPSCWAAQTGGGPSFFYRRQSGLPLATSSPIELVGAAGLQTQAWS